MINTPFFRQRLQLIILNSLLTAILIFITLTAFSFINNLPWVDETMIDTIRVPKTLTREQALSLVRTMERIGNDEKVPEGLSIEDEEIFIVTKAYEIMTSEVAIEP